MKRIPLTRGLFAIVDDEDYEYLMRWKWHAVKRKRTYYAIRIQSRYIDGRKTRKRICMHRVIMQIPQGRETDHRNHDGLDNRRTNLRECSTAENQHNQIPRVGTSRYKGVNRNRGAWHARIGCNGKRIHIGCYASEKDAANAYDAKAIEIFGEFAYLNF